MVFKGDQRRAAADQAAAGLGVVDGVELLRGEVEKPRKLGLIVPGLVQHHQQLRVGQHHAALVVVQQIVHVLGDGRGLDVALAEHPPGAGDELACLVLLQENVELVQNHMGADAVHPVPGSAVHDGVRHDQHSGRPQLVVQVVDVEDHHPLVQIHGGSAAEDVHGAQGVALHGKGDGLGLGLGLLQQLLPQIPERGLNAGALLLREDKLQAAVDEGLFLGTGLAVVQQLQQGENEIHLRGDGLLLRPGVALHHGQSVQPVRAAVREAEDHAVVAERFPEASIFPLGVADKDAIIGVEDDPRQHLLGHEGLAGAGHAEEHGGLVHQICAVDQDWIMADGVLPEVDSARVHDLHNAEGNENGLTLGDQRPVAFQLPGADGQDRVQAVQLLEFQDRHLAHLSLGGGQQSLGLPVQLLLGVGGQKHREHTEEHLLVLPHEIVQEGGGLRPLQLHVVGHVGGEVVVAVLPALPVGDVGLHAQELLLHLPHGLVGGNGLNIHGEGHVGPGSHQIRYQLVGDDGSVVFEIEDAGPAVPDPQAVAGLLHTVGADRVSGVVALPGHVAGREVIGLGVLRAVEARQQLQLFRRIQRLALGAELRKGVAQPEGLLVEELHGVPVALPADRDGDIALQGRAQPVAALARHQVVALLAVLVLAVSPKGHENPLVVEVLPHGSADQGDLRHGVGVQPVQQGREAVVQARPGVQARGQIVDIREAEGLGIEIRADLEHSVLPDTADGDQVLYAARNPVGLFIRLNHFLCASQHGVSSPPFAW